MVMKMIKLIPRPYGKTSKNTFELSQLDWVGMHLMEQQQFREIKEQEKNTC